MIAILSVISIFIAIVGALTFHEASYSAAVKRDYEGLWRSTIMLLVGVFCIVFFLGDITSALAATALTTIVEFVAHSIISYTSIQSHSFNNGKLQRNELPENGGETVGRRTPASSRNQSLLHSQQPAKGEADINE